MIKSPPYHTTQRHERCSLLVTLGSIYLFFNGYINNNNTAATVHQCRISNDSNRALYCMYAGTVIHHPNHSSNQTPIFASIYLPSHPTSQSFLSTCQNAIHLIPQWGVCRVSHYLISLSNSWVWVMNVRCGLSLLRCCSRFMHEHQS